MITADTITDEQIRSIVEHPLYLAAKEADRPPWRVQLHYVRVALARPEPSATGHGNQDITAWRNARARCAEILNARVVKP